LVRSSRRLIVLAAPSGAGKTTIAHKLLDRHPNWRFSVSATTRNKRFSERDGVDYHFLTREEFERSIATGDLVEYEEIFGNLYGTLVSQTKAALERSSDEKLVFDVDVNGALSLRKAFPNDAFLIFIAPPSVDVLEERLRGRATETAESIAIRMSRVEMEMEEAKSFDAIVINDRVDRAVEEIESLISK
jgi:guanylate kinase